MDVGTTVHFDASGSTDPDGDPLTYSWDLDGDGVFGDSTDQQPAWTYNTPGSYGVRLRVSDPNGGVGTDSLRIGVGLPKVTIATPAASVTWAVGDTVSFSSSATDYIGASIPDTGLTWRLVLKHGLCPDCHDHVLQTYTGKSGDSFVAPDHAYPSELQLTLTATDASGLSNTTEVRLLPRTTTIGFATNPAGLSVTFNGSSATAPYSRTVIVGSKNSFSTSSPQNSKGKVLPVVVRRDHAAVHPDVEVTAPVTYTATFAKR